MLVRHTATAVIAATLRVTRAELDRRITGMLTRLEAPLPEAAGA